MTPTLDEMLAQARAGDIHALGAAISPLDDRDYIAYPPAPGAPSQFTVAGVGKCPVYNQQGGTCTGYSIAAVLSYLEFKETGQRRTFDGSELHHRLVPSYSNGVWPREVLEDVRLRGAKASISGSATGLYRISGYAGVPLDPDSVLTALSTYGPLQAVVWMGKSLMDAWVKKSVNYVPAPAAKEEELLHSILIVSADRAKGVVIQNNWGTHFGAPFGGIPGGFHMVSWEWLRMQGVEAWSLADASNTQLEGWIKNHEDNYADSEFLLVRRPDKPAVYAVAGGTRDWIKNQAELMARGLAGRRIEIRHSSDPVWGYPVIGVDSPESGRA